MTKPAKQDKISVSAGFRDAQGRTGVRVEVLLAPTDGEGWAGYYHYRTHGMTLAETRARLDAVIGEHAKKAARLTGFKDLVSQNVRGVAHAYEWRHCRIVEAGTDVRLEIRLRVAGTQERINITRTAGSVDGLPPNAEIVSIILDAVAQYEQQEVDADNHVRAVKKALGV
jgi:hypothetical protein